MNKIIMSIILSLRAIPAFAGIYQFTEGETFEGDLYQFKTGSYYHGKINLHKKCTVTVKKIVARDDKGIHCRDLYLETSFYKKVVVLGTFISGFTSSDAGTCSSGNTYADNERRTSWDPNNFTDNYIGNYSSNDTNIPTKGYKTLMYLDNIVKRDGKPYTVMVNDTSLFGKNLWCEFEDWNAYQDAAYP